MGPVATSNTHLFLVTVLVSLMRLDAAIEPCPTPCRCTLEILNCSRITNPPGLHRVPLPKSFGHPHVFFFFPPSPSAQPPLALRPAPSLPACSLQSPSSASTSPPRLDRASPLGGGVHSQRRERAREEGERGSRQAAESARAPWTGAGGRSETRARARRGPGAPTPRPSLPSRCWRDFTGNAISSIGKQVWRAYPWAEYLVLKSNSLSRLRNTSLEGLLSLTHLDLSCNKIQIIERNAFEPVPFLQFINLSGNVIEQITQGAFRAWHGMQFLLKLVLNHNPLAVIEDACFYKLPSLKFLDLGATEITPKILVDLLKTSLQLKTLILPKKMSCCLCRIQDDIEVLCETVKLDCTDTCAANATLCEKEEPLNRMQDEVMKVLETRKLNTSNTLSIVPEKPLHDNVTLALSITQDHSHLGIHFHKLAPHLLNSVKQLGELNTNDFLDMKWADKSELKKLYMLANLLKVALKERIAKDERESQETEVQKETSKQVSEESKDTTIRKKRHLKKVQSENWLRKRSRKKESFIRLGRARREFAKAAMQPAEQPDNLDLWRKLAEGFEPQSATSLLRPHRDTFWSSWKRSTSHSPTQAPDLTASIVVDDNASDLTGKVVIILKHSNRSRKPNYVKHPPVGEQDLKAVSQNSLSDSHPVPSQNDLVGGNSEKLLGNSLESQTLHKEELLNQLMNGGGKSKIPADDSETLNDLSPDITLSHETHWEHHEQRPSISPPLNLLPPPDDYLFQGDLFEAELNKRLASLIPNAPVRSLISHVIRILKMDCTEPTIQMACAKLISRTGLLMKLFSERENLQETSSLWKSYFWSAKNVANMTTMSPRKIGKPSDEIARQGIPEYGYGNKLLLAISVTAVIMIIIAVICLIEICSQRSAAKSREGTPQEKRTFLGRKKKGAPEKQTSAASSLDKPLWLKDMYQPLDEIRKKNMVDKLHDEESSEEDDIFNWANARPPEVPEPPLEKPIAKASSAKLEPVPEPPAKKASSKKLVPVVEKEETTTEVSSPKIESSGAEEDEGTASKKPSSGEEEEEDE